MCDVIQELVNEERAIAWVEGWIEGWLESWATGWAECSAEVRAEVMEIVFRKKKISIVKGMLKRGTIPVKNIADISGLSLNEINILAKELQDS